MDQLKDVLSRVRSICGDPDGDWITDSYILPMVNHIYDLQIQYLAKFCSPYITRSQTVPNVPIGTTELAKYQNKDQPLYGLMRPLEPLQWKQAGLPPQFYRSAKRANILPNISPAAPHPQFALFWRWKSFVIYLTPMDFAIDLLVEGEFRPAPLLKPEDYIAVHPNLVGALTEETAACAMRERANQGQMQSYQLVGTAALDDIADQLVQTEQNIPVRIGRMNSRHSRGW